MSEDVKNKEEKRETKKLPIMEVGTSNEMIISVKGKEDRVYRFVIPFHAPLSEAYNAACNVANDIAIRFNEAIEKQKEEIKKAEEEIVAEEEEEVVEAEEEIEEEK